MIVRLTCLWMLMCCGATRLSAQQPPNFVLVFADDLGYAYLGCYDAIGIETPVIDRLATEVRKFTDFYVASPTCTPSRAALLTGCYPLRAGFDDAIAVKADGSRSPSRVLWPGSPLGIHADEVTVAEVLKDAGYATGMIGLP